ncbi:putative membrane protein [Tepidamorphus gemmatus]|uniref:Putative membrane protein n=1 Tax=Tepidamorphus gemmatus TaxID=747076 RepID=A0A4R3M074_9HYPH|nr:TIGR01620 family protein [Tepidamorphus gemmatus]TCT06454.1 putative membrane protein [Tepidamorphus gemmatus]
MTNERIRRPVAFRLSDPGVTVEEPAVTSAGRRKAAGAVVIPEPDISGSDIGPGTLPGPLVPRRRGLPWGRIFAGTVATFLTFAVGVWVTDFVVSLFQRDDVLGWIAAVLATAVALGLAGLVGREAVGLARLARVTRLRADAEAAASADDREAARAIVRQVIALYATRPETARARAEVEDHAGEIIDGRDLLRLAERELMVRIDREARALVTGAAQRVSVVTAMSPRALIDIVYVIVETLRLVRRIATLYGGRPSGLAMIRLMRLAIGHLAVTGGMALGDGLVQQLVGHGLAARLSARLGEGMINGMMTARIGLAALDVCRPLPWLAGPPPGLGDVMATLAGTGLKKDD